MFNEVKRVNGVAQEVSSFNGFTHEEVKRLNEKFHAQFPQLSALLNQARLLM